MKEDEKTIVNNYVSGFQFNGCEILNPAFQTIVQGDMRMEGNGENACPAKNGTHEPEYGEETGSGESPEVPEEPQDELPEELAAPVARKLLGKLADAGLLDGAFRPVGLSLAKRGVLASLLATKLDITNPWQVFGTLWGVKPETLRTAYNKGMNQTKTLDFQGRIKSIIG